MTDREANAMGAEGTCMDVRSLRPGNRVRAFHPGRFGVVNEGSVVKVGRKYVSVDFGPMLGGTWRVAFGHIVERVS